MSGLRFGARVLAGAAVVSVGGSAAWAADLFPPVWRGQAQTTFQQWNFTGGAGGGAPDVMPFHNPYGVPELFEVGGAEWEPVSSAPGVVPRDSVWKVSGSGKKVCADNKNTAVDVVLFAAAKLDCLQVVYFGDLPVVSVEEIAGHGSFTTVLDSVSVVPLADGWFHATYYHTLMGTASPSRELFVLEAPLNGTTWIDHLVIDTVALPSPGAGVLGAMGVLVAVRRRRR